MTIILYNDFRFLDQVVRVNEEYSVEKQVTLCALKLMLNEELYVMESTKTAVSHCNQYRDEAQWRGGNEFSDVNNDWTCKDKDQAYKDLTHKDFTYSYLLQVAAKPTIAIKQQQ